MPGSAFREQAGASTRAPSTSTTQTRHTFTGRQVLDVAERRRVDPELRQASRIVAPSGRATARPSTLSSTIRRCRSAQLALPCQRLGGSVEDAQLADRRLDGGSRRSARARRSTRRACLAELAEQRQLRSTPPSGAPRDEPRERLLLAHGSHPAGHALAARLVAEEGGDALEQARQVDGLVEHDHDARAEGRPGVARVLEGERHVELVGADEAPRGASQQHRLQRRPAGTPPASSSSSRSVAPKRHLVQPRPRDVAGDAEELGPGRALRCRRAANAGAGPEHDVEHVHERLDVVHDRRLAEEADLDRERRLVARLAAVALDRVEERGLLAADVGARAAAHLDVEAKPSPITSSPRKPRVARDGERVLERVMRLRVLAAHVDVAALAAGGVARRWSSPRRARTGPPP